MLGEVAVVSFFSFLWLNSVVFIYKSQSLQNTGNGSMLTFASILLVSFNHNSIHKLPLMLHGMGIEKFPGLSLYNVVTRTGRQGLNL